MNWSAVKNLLIGILVAANLFLVFNIARQDRARGYIDDDEVLGAVELLAERGLEVPPECIPREKFKAPVYESLYSDEYYTKAAEALSASPREVLLSLPNGGFSITSQNGAVTEFDAEFGFTYSKYNNFDVVAYNEITAENFASEAVLWDDVTSSRLITMEKRAEEFLGLCTGDSGVLAAVVTDSYFDSERGFTYLLARQVLGGYTIYSHYAVCVFENDELIYAGGRWYFAPIDEDYQTELVDQVNILFSDLSELNAGSAQGFALSEETPHDTEMPSDAFPGDAVLSAVRNMQAVYAIYWNADKSAIYFIPAWQIDHSDGMTLVYNATNSTIYARK